MRCFRKEGSHRLAALVRRGANGLRLLAGREPASSDISNVFVEPLFGGRGRSGRAAAEAGGARRFGLAGHDCGGQGIAERVWAVARARFRLA